MSYFPTIEPLARRQFLTSSAGSLGRAALGWLLLRDGVLARDTSAGIGAPEADRDAAASPLAWRAPHFAPRAAHCIYLFLGGGLSQMELFDPKPELDRLAGQPIPESFTKGLQFAFLDPKKSVLMGSPFKFRRYGECGMPLSELLPHIGSCADDIGMIHSMHHKVFAHAQAELETLTGKDVTGRPSAGAWMAYGLGSESANLPAYAALMTGRGPTTRSLAWGNGFLPSEYSATLLRNQGEPILDLQNPAGVSSGVRRRQLDALARLNSLRHEAVGDREIQAKIAAYELAFRMQTSAPELIDLASESQQTLNDYGASESGDKGDFGRNCLLARRLVERGVRFVSIFHRKWDQHSNLGEEYPALCLEIDQAIGALIKDLKGRGMLDSTLVVCGTEFGRTALTQNAQPGPGAGRDHHPFAYTQWMAGGGVRGGHSVGRTDAMAWNVIEDPVHVNDFHATLLHLFGLDHLRLTYRFRGLDVRLTDQGGKVVTKVLA